MPDKLLEGNKKWVERMRGENPEFFGALAAGQKPRYLWIGCSDSRVPATEITDTQAGSIFVHRNIANLVVETDLNLLSVVNYAVYHLKVEHIIVCGHYGCGGIRAALDTKQSLGFLDGWIGLIRTTYASYREELDGILDPEERERRFTELNIAQQVKHLSRIYFVQDRWRINEAPHIHGWVYDVRDGLIKDLGVSQKGPVA